MIYLKDRSRDLQKEIDDLENLVDKVRACQLVLNSIKQSLTFAQQRIQLNMLHSSTNDPYRFELRPSSEEGSTEHLILHEQREIDRLENLVSMQQAEVSTSWF